MKKKPIQWECYRIGSPHVDKGAGSLSDLERPLPPELHQIVAAYHDHSPFKLELIIGDRVYKVWK